MIGRARAGLRDHHNGYGLGGRIRRRNARLQARSDDTSQPLAEAPPDRSRIPRLLIKALAVYSAAAVTLIAVAVLVGSSLPRERAIILMALGLIVIWVVGFGLFTLRFRDTVRRRVAGARGDWRLKFFLFASTLLLLEEVVSTSMTNLAPFLGSARGEAYITASDNYFLVIAFHSASVLIPAYAGWAWLLSRFDFTPNEVFLLYGFLGTTAEAMINPTALIAGFWFFVYGLMVYLPAYSIPRDRGAVRPKAKHYLLSYFVPLACQIPVVVLVFTLKGILGIQLFTD
jgi:hypothetical protein